MKKSFLSVIWLLIAVELFAQADVISRRQDSLRMDSLKEQVPPMEIRRFRGQYVMEPVEMKPSYGQVSLAYLPDSLIRDTLRYEYRQGRIHIYMDEEVMQGATIQITFKITVTNNSEIDYTGQNGNLGYAYYTGQVSSSDRIVTTTVDKIIDYVDNSLTFRKVDSPEWSLIETMREFTTTSEGAQVEIEKMDYGTFIETMMERYGEDYVAEHLREFEAQYQVYVQTGRLEDIGSIGGNNSNQEDEEENTVGNHLSNYNVIQNMKNRENGIAYLNEDLNIVKTKSAQTVEEPITQVIVTKALEDVELKPGESASVDLVLSKTLSPEEVTSLLNELADEMIRYNFKNTEKASATIQSEISDTETYYYLSEQPNYLIYKTRLIG